MQRNIQMHAFHAKLTSVLWTKSLHYQCWICWNKNKLLMSLSKTNCSNWLHSLSCYPGRFVHCYPFSCSKWKSPGLAQRNHCLFSIIILALEEFPNTSKKICISFIFLFQFDSQHCYEGHQASKFSIPYCLGSRLGWNL